MNMNIAVMLWHGTWNLTGIENTRIGMTSCLDEAVKTAE
jgi:hypothetical protein